MTPNQIHELTPLMATVCAGVLMVKCGFAKNTLKLRNPVRRCASCGKLRNTCTCAHR